MMTTASAHDKMITEHGAMMRRVALAAVVTGLFLVAIKLVAFIVTDSVAMMASLSDSALDVIGSFVNLLAIRHARTPADREHRFVETFVLSSWDEHRRQHQRRTVTDLEHQDALLQYLRPGSAPTARHFVAPSGPSMRLWWF